MTRMSCPRFQRKEAPRWPELVREGSEEEGKPGCLNCMTPVVGISLVLPSFLVTSPEAFQLSYKIPRKSETLLPCSSS